MTVNIVTKPTTATVVDACGSDKAIEFLQHEYSHRDGFISIVAIGPDLAGIAVQTASAKEIQTLAPFIQKSNGQRNLYFSANTVKSNLTKKAARADVCECVGLHADIDPRDNCPLGEERQRIVTLLEDFVPVPSIIVDSGGGYQAFWRFKKPILVNEANLTKLELYNKRLASALGGDSCWSLEHLMRLPGTYNLPNKKKRAKGRQKAMAKVMHQVDGAYELSDFDNLAPLKTELQDQESEPIAVQLPHQFLDLLQGSKDTKLKARWEGDTSDLQDTSRSGLDMSLTSLLVSRHFSDKDIASVLIQFPHGKAREKYEQGDCTYIFAMINKARASHTSPHAPQVNGNPLLPLLSKEKLSRTEKLEISRCIRQQLQLRGRFYLVKSADHESQDLCYLHSDEHQLYRLRTPQFRALCEEQFTLNAADPVARYVEEHLVTHCWRYGSRTETYRLARYQNGTLYVDASDHTVFRLNGESITTINNGDDGILFEHHSTQEVIQPDFHYTGSPVRQYLVDIANAVNTDRLALYHAYIYTLFFESLLPTKPILLWLGPKGSAKTSVCRALKCGLLGYGANVDTGLTDKEDAFWAAVCHSPFVCIDNVDSHVRWLPDALATVSTGVKFNRRKFYKTNALVDYTPRCFPILTSRSPQTFSRDDVVDRLLIMEVKRRETFIDEAQLLFRLHANRNQIWGELLNSLNKIVAELKNPANTHPLPYRMADWARLTLRIAPILGIGNIEHQLQALAHSKIDFALSNDPVAQALEEWIDAHPDHKPISTGGLYKSLCEMRDAQGHKFCIKSPQAFGIKLCNLESELQVRYHMETTNGPDNTKLVRFSKKEHCATIVTSGSEN